MIEKNSVAANAQVKKEHYIEIFNQSCKTKVLFIGNSIPRHEPKPEIGWNNDWGMAATSRENDYVHVCVKMLEQKYGQVSYCIANCGEWEINYFDEQIINEWKVARDYCADIVVIRIGENIWQSRDKLETYPLKPQFKKMVEYFSSNPNAIVIITGLFWENEQLESIISQVATEKGLTFVRLNDLSLNEENMAIGQFWHDGVAVHPSDKGMAKIAQRIAEVL